MIISIVGGCLVGWNSKNMLALLGLMFAQLGIFLIMSTPAHSQDFITFAPEPVQTRIEAGEDRVIKAQVAKHAVHAQGSVLAIDGVQDAVEISANDRYADLVHAITSGAR